MIKPHMSCGLALSLMSVTYVYLPVNVVIDKSKRDGKFTPVSQEGIFLGYDGYSKNYRVLIDSKVTVHNREYVRFEENVAGPFHSDLPPLVDMIDDDEDAFADSETRSDSLDGPVDLPTEKISENVLDGSLAPLGNEFTIPLLDKLTLEMARDLGRTEAPSDPESFGTDSENKRPAGSQDFVEPGTCSTSGLSTRPCMDVPQVAAHLGVEDLVPGPQLEPVKFNFESAGISHSPASLFGGRYPERKRNTVLQPEINQTAAKPTFCGYVQVQKDTVIVEPESYIEAINSPKPEQWVNAMQDEMKSLKALGTWSYVMVDDKQKKRPCQ
jgi:hypothetical protein